MANSMAMSDFASHSMSPIPSTRHSYEFPPYINVKTEMDYGYAVGQMFGPGISNSPHGLSSCMYAASGSPHIPPATSPDHCASIASSVKENSLFSGPPSCRRRLDFNHNDFVDVTKVGTVAVAKRNERERNRVKLINMTFQTLRQHLPLGSSGSKGKTRKLSKVQTLRSAIDYIRQLEDLVQTKQHQQRQQQFDHRQGQDGRGSSSVCCRAETQSPYLQGDMEIASPAKRTDPKSYFVCHTPGHTISTSSSTEKVLSRQSTGTSTASSNLRSPYSDASSYDAVTTPDDEELIDFDDWF